MKNNVLKYNILIALAALALFLPCLGAVHLFDWDEVNFAECAREMLVTGDYFSVKINFQPFWEKPPLFIWLQALSMNIFGINEFAARFPDAMCGMVTLLVLFNIGRKLVDIKFGLIWVLVYAGSLLPHFYFKSGIIDPWFNLFIFCGIYFFVSYSNNSTTGNKKHLLLSAVFIGIAMLTKGPVAILVFSLCYVVYWATKRFSKVLSLSDIILYAITVLLIGGLWFLLLAFTGNTAIIKEFFIYQVRLFNTQDSGHGGPFFYHWIVLLIGCFPLSIFALRAFRKHETDTLYQKHFKQWMLIMFWVVLILFSIVKTKIVHYSSLCYFPLSFLAAYGVYKLYTGTIPWKKYTSVLLLVVASLIGLAISTLPLVDKFKQAIIESGIIKDKFAVENLKANVHWTGVEWLIGAFLIIGTIIMLLQIRRQQIKQGITGIFIISLLAVNLSMLVVVPRIEPYSQGAAIEFYKYLQHKDCYIETIGYKSYAHLFYSRKKPQANPNSYQQDWLINGPIDKPAYFVCKINIADEVIREHPQLKEIYRKNGFAFFMRSPIPVKSAYVVL